jgi:hypothetical protein
MESEQEIKKNNLQIREKQERNMTKKRRNNGKE